MPDVDSIEAVLLSDPPPRRRTWPALGTVVAMGVLLALATWMWMPQPPPPPGQVDMLAGLPHDGVVAADTSSPHVGGQWLVTSGSLLTRNGQLWSGRPDAGPAAPAQDRTGSAVLRAVSTSRDFKNVHVFVEMKLTALSTTTRTSAQAWDGVHIFLRYQNQTDLYAVDLTRRDGTLAIKRKRTAGADVSAADISNGGVYKTLATTRHAMSHQWHSYEVSVANGPRDVRISLSVDGKLVLSAVDPDTASLRDAGAVGLRGDNANFTIRKFLVKPTS
jgi:hypothetical protein